MAMSPEDNQAARIRRAGSLAGGLVNLLRRRGLKAGRSSVPAWLREPYHTISPRKAGRRAAPR